MLDALRNRSALARVIIAGGFTLVAAVVALWGAVLHAPIFPMPHYQDLAGHACL